jgi:excisionase family DNA binding protein
MDARSLRTRAGLCLYVRQVARRLGRPERTIRHWAQTGRLPARRHGPKLWVFDEQDVALFSEAAIKDEP